MLVIDPDECIDCTLCVAECPVEAIFAEDDVPDDQKSFTALNAELAKLWKPIAVGFFAVIAGIKKMLFGGRKVETSLERPIA